MSGKEVERLRAELARLHEGEADDPGEPGTWPTPAQWIRRWNDMTPERRLEIAGGAVDGMQVAAVCRYQPGHEGQIAELQTQRDALKSAIERGEVARFAAEVARLVKDYAHEERGIIALTPFEATLDQLCLEKYGFDLDRVVTLDAPEAPGDES